MVGIARNNRRAGHVSTVFCFVLAVAAGEDVWAATDTPGTEEVVAAWRQREENVKSLRFVCQCDHVITQGSLHAPSFLRRSQETVIPPEDTSLKLNFTYLLEGKKVFYSQTGQKWDPRQNKPATEDSSYSFDSESKVFKTLSAKGEGICPQAAEFYDYAGPSLLFGKSTISPLALIYRPFAHYLPDRQISVETTCMRECRAAPTPQALVSIAFWPVKSPDSIHYVWVDPAREYLPCRCLLERSGNVIYDLSIEYRKDESGQWVPKKWNAKSFGMDGKLESIHRIQVLECSINRPVGDKAFDITFPYGTWVNEYRDGESRSYLVFKGGRRRYLSGSERDVRQYEQLMADGPGQPE